MRQNQFEEEREKSNRNEKCCYCINMYSAFRIISWFRVVKYIVFGLLMSLVFYILKLADFEVFLPYMRNFDIDQMIKLIEKVTDEKMSYDEAVVNIKE